ncbi:hypothetical protein F5888DRAFT_1707467 [Russula emetica]|nr:hypothetical protein F5888DRAFT_1707467 [Russula emetica]
MRSLWGDMDGSIRITSRSICALVARQVIRKQRLKGEVLSWLQEVIGESSNSILEADVTMLDQMNFKSFVNGVLPDYMWHHDFSTEDAASFNETLAILLGVRADGHDYFTTPDWQTRLSEEVGRIRRYDRQGGSVVFDKLRLVFPSLPPVTSAHAVVPPSHPIPPPSPVLPPPREVLPPRAPPSPHPVPHRAAPPPPPLAVYPPRAPPSPRSVPHRAAPPPRPLAVYPPRAPPSPRPVPLRAAPPPPPPRAIRPSHRAHRHHAQM